MVSSVASTPLAFLNQIQGVTPAATAAPAAAAASTPSTTESSASGSSSAGTSATATSQALVSSLLSGGAYSSSVLSLLQENSSGSFDPITSLLGGTSTNNALTGLYSSLYSTVESAAVTEAKDNATQSAAGSAATTAAASQTSAQNLIAAQTQASVAYNQTLQQNAASAASANAYGPDGVTKLVG